MGYRLCQRMGFCGSVKMLSVKLAALRFQPDLVIWRNNCFSFQWAGQLGFVTRVFVTFEGRSSLAGSLASVAWPPPLWPASCLFFEMTPQIVCMRGSTVTLVAMVSLDSLGSVASPTVGTASLPVGCMPACPLGTLGHTQFGPSEQIHNMGMGWRGLPSLMDSIGFHVQLDPPKTMSTQNKCALNRQKCAFVSNGHFPQLWILDMTFEASVPALRTIWTEKDKGTFPGM